MTARPLRSCLIAALLLLPLAARAEELAIPILVPLTGFLSLEGQSQRNGALLAFAHGTGGAAIRHDVADTGVSPEIAVNQLEKALEAKPVAIVASMLGTQMLAMLPRFGPAKMLIVSLVAGLVTLMLDAVIELRTVGVPVKVVVSVWAPGVFVKLTVPPKALAAA